MTIGPHVLDSDFFRALALGVAATALWGCAVIFVIPRSMLVGCQDCTTSVEYIQRVAIVIVSGAPFACAFALLSAFIGGLLVRWLRHNWG